MEKRAEIERKGKILRNRVNEYKKEKEGEGEWVRERER